MENLTLKELKEHIGFLLEHGCDGEEEVLINVSEPSVGSRAGVGVKNISAGFDWERGQIRIAPVEELIRKEKDRDKPQAVKVREFDLHYKNRKKTIVRSCPVCENHVKRDDRYCARCGQRIEQ